MGNPKNREEFKQYCLRRLGAPVIDINVDDDQIDDRIDDALQFYADYHFDGSEKIYMKHQFCADDLSRKWIYCPDDIISINMVFPWDDSNASINMFDLRYQLRLHDLYDFTSVSYVSYEITMSHLQTLNMLFSGLPQHRYNRQLNKIYLDINWESDAQLGKYVVIEGYRKVSPDDIQISGTISSNLTTGILPPNNLVMMDGTDTKFTQELIEGDVIILSTGDEVQVNRIAGDNYLTFYKPPANTVVGATMTKKGISKVWSDRFFKQYACAKIKYQWGENISKYAGIQMPGGVTLDGPRIIQEAQIEIDKMEEEMMIMNILPSEMYTG